MEQNFDVVVIGSGTAGCFFAHEMAEQGYSVCVIDKSPPEQLGQRLQIFHVDKLIFEKLGSPGRNPVIPITGMSSRWGRIIPRMASIWSAMTAHRQL